jgi:hypothetical protein
MMLWSWHETLICGIENLPLGKRNTTNRIFPHCKYHIYIAGRIDIKLSLNCALVDYLEDALVRG